MKKKIKLSVCVPTYNRPNELRRGLQLIIPQLTAECELIIRDDSDNNDSKHVIEELITNPEFEFSYFKGPKIGLDLANIFLLEHARGEYIWWFSDDDELLEGAVKHFFDIMNKNIYPTFIWMNFISSTSGKLAVSHKNEGMFTDNGEFLDTVGPSIGLLSCFILNRKKGLPYTELAKSRSIGFGFASMVPIFGAISVDDKVYFVKGPYIKNNPESISSIRSKAEKNAIKVGTQAYEIYAINFPDTLRLFEDGLDRSAVKRLISRNFCHFWRGLVIGVALGYDTVSGKRKELIKRYWWHPEFIPAFILLNTPKTVLNRLYRAYKLLKD